MHRANEHLQKILKSYPKLNQKVNFFLSLRGQEDIPEWPKWCFLPMSAWYAIVSDRHGVNRLPFNLIKDVSRLAAIGCWRYTQGVYRFDSTTMEEIIKSPISGNLPTEVLQRLPEWCVYIETPGLSWLDHAVAGFWVHLEWDANTERKELRFLLDTDKELVALPLHIGDWTIVDAVSATSNESLKQARQANIDLPVELLSITTELASQLNKFISLVLYVCSEQPEIDNEREPGVSPYNPKPQKTKKGPLIFPAQKTKIWTVGKNTGEILRRQRMIVDSKPAVLDEHPRAVRPHVRRAHWHGYWTGPKKAEQRFVYKWIAPVIVRGSLDTKDRE